MTMEVITSTSNNKVKLVKSLSQKKHRDESGLFVAEGLNLLKDLPKRFAVDSVFATAQTLDTQAELIASLNSEVFCVSDAVLRSMGETVTPQGLVAVIKKPESVDTGGNALVLDGISDPGNLGTLIRTAAGAGIENVFVCGGADCYSGKCVRSAMGGLFRVNVLERTASEVLTLLGKRRLYVMDMSGEDLFLAQTVQPFAIVLGSEAHGVGDEFTRGADKILSLKMRGGQESLNVAVAGGIAMYALTRGNK